MPPPFRLPVTAKAGLLVALALESAVLLAEGHAAIADNRTAAAPAPVALEPVLLDVVVNGQHGSEPVEFLRDGAGGLYVSADFLRGWRIRRPEVAGTAYDGETYYPATAIPGLRLAIDPATQSATIDFAPGAFETQLRTLNGREPIIASLPASGGFLNYDLFVEHSGGETAFAGFFDGGIFTRHGVGTTSFFASAGGDRTHVTRLETTWTIDRPNHLSSIRIGDAISSAGPGAAPARFAGVQFARNFAVQPGYLTMPLPAANGSATVPSIVDIYVNNTLQGQQSVQPGPFELSNVPVPSGGGTVQLVVRDLLGREVVTAQNYYAAPLMLRRGLHDFSYEAGFLRENFGQRNDRYGAFFASTTHRYGFTDRITGEATAQVSESRQMVGVAVNAIAFDLASVGGSVALSHSPRGWGMRSAVSFERRGSGVSFGVLADYATREYTTIGLESGRPQPRFTLQAFADMPLGRGGVGVNFLYRSLRDGPSQTVAGVFGNWRVSRDASVQLFARRSMIGRSETSLGLHLSLNLGGRRSASASVEHDRSGTAGYVSFQSDPPAGPGHGFRAIARLGDSSGVEATYVRNFSIARVTAEAGYVRGTAGVRLSAAGSIGFLGGRAFASRSLGESFATVKLDGFPNVRVYADNQPVGTTDASGFIVVPGLRAFDRNTIRIEQADLPLDATLESEEIEVTPYARAGIPVRFAVRRERGALLHIKLEDGSPLPAGAIVRIVGGAQSWVAVSGGEVYLPGMIGSVSMRATWGGQSCGFIATVPDNDDPQPLIEGLICRREADYAVR